MNTFKTSIFSVILAFILIMSSCKKDQSDHNETMISSYDDNESHNNGENCMICHVQGGSGEGWFTVAGSIYASVGETPYANATVKLYSEANGEGTLIKTIKADGKGNFYTTESIDFTDGLYTGVTSVNGTEVFMNSSLSSGKCNSCHGNSADLIRVN